MSLLKIIRKLKQKEKELRIIVLGLDNAGKTTILKRLLGEDVHTISPTLGFSISTLEHKDNKLNVWDVGGQKSLRPYWKNYFESTDGLVFVVDSSDKMRLQDSKNELRSLLGEERLEAATLLILANKQDLPGSLPLDKIEEILELSSIKVHRWKLFACSAFKGNQLVEAIDWMVDDITRRIFSS